MEFKPFNEKQILVDFSEEEFDRICEVAKGRNNPKLGVVQNRRIDNSRGDLEINITGVASEFAIGTLLGVEIDERSLLAGDDGHDLIYRECTVQVKFNNTRYGDLYFNDLETFKSEFGVLVVPYSGHGVQRVILAGWIDRITFCQSWSTKNYGKGDRVAVNQGQLKNIYKLRDRLDMIADQRGSSGKTRPSGIILPLEAPRRTAAEAWAAAGLKVSQERIDSHGASLKSSN